MSRDSHVSCDRATKKNQVGILPLIEIKTIRIWRAMQEYWNFVTKFLWCDSKRLSFSWILLLADERSIKVPELKLRFSWECASRVLAAPWNWTLVIYIWANTPKHIHFVASARLCLRLFGRHYQPLESIFNLSKIAYFRPNERRVFFLKIIEIGFSQEGK